MHGHFWHTLAVTNQLLDRGLHKATTSQMIGCCPVPISFIADAHFGARLGAFFICEMFWKQCIVRQYHSELSDQSALEIRVRIWVRLIELHYF